MALRHRIYNGILQNFKTTEKNGAAAFKWPFS